MPAGLQFKRVSFVIPVLDEAVGIGTLLRDLRERYPDCEIIVVGGICYTAVVA